MLSFAGIGTWRFGPHRSDFGDIKVSCQTLFTMTFGEFPKNWCVLLTRYEPCRPRL